MEPPNQRRRIASDGRPVGPGGVVGQLRDLYRQRFESRVNIGVVAAKEALIRRQIMDLMADARFMAEADPAEYLRRTEYFAGELAVLHRQLDMLPDLTELYDEHKRRFGDDRLQSLPGTQAEIARRVTSENLYQ